MVKQFRSVAFSISVLGAVLLGTVAPYTHAETEQDCVQLKPYTAQYVTRAKGISITLDRELSRTAQGSYRLTNGGSKLVAGFEEESLFRVENGRVIPQSYVYQGTGLMNRRREVHITAGAPTLRSLYKDKWYELPYTDNTFDRMSQLEQFRLQLLQDKTPRETDPMTVADGKRVKEYQLDFVAEEILNTPMGRIKTLHFRRQHDDPERTSDTWLAPEWDYLMVKTLHVDEGSPVEVNLTNAAMDGVVLTGKQ